MLRIPTLLTVLFLFTGCGAKTGLLIGDPDEEVNDADVIDADVEVDAEVDAEPDVEIDADPDIDVCEPTSVTINPQRAEVTFLIDRSNSMLWGLEGTPDDPGWPSRWILLRDALDGALRESDHLLEIGAKFRWLFSPTRICCNICSVRSGFVLRSLVVRDVVKIMIESLVEKFYPDE